MRITTALPPLLAVVAAVAVAVPTPARAGPDTKDCRDTVSCQRPGHTSNSPGAPDPATAQLLGNVPNPIPPLAAIG